MMKKPLILLASFFVFSFAFAQTDASLPRLTVKWTPTALVAGSVSLQSEYNFGGKSSLTTKIGIPVSSHHSFAYDGNDGNFDIKTVSFLAGYRTYLSKKHLRGLYVEPYFKYVHLSGEGLGNSTLGGKPVIMNITNEYSGAGVGAQLGAQFLIRKRFVLDFFFLGPEINSSTNHLKAVEVSHALPWTTMEARDAEKDIRDFVDQIPFIRNKTAITVDQNERTVSADFKGLLPGFRAGVSLGIAL